MLLRCLMGLVLILSCQSGPINHTPQSSSFGGTAMAMQYRVVLGAHLKNKERMEVKETISRAFKEINQTYNVWNPKSELNTINRMKKDKKHKLSKGLEKLLKETEVLVKLTEGRFDPTVEPMHKLWKQHLEQKSIPSDGDIARIAPAVGWHNIHIEDGLLQKNHDLTSLDLGGIAKGLCVDMIVERLNALGYKDVYAEWGGEIRASGKHPAGRPWSIYISRLGDTRQENAVSTLPLVNQAVATSGDYIQYWVVEDQGDGTGQPGIYCHIIDPRSKKPLKITDDSIASITVKASSCQIADALATAAMMFPSAEEARLWISRLQEEIPDTAFWIVTRMEEEK